MEVTSVSAEESPERKRKPRERSREATRHRLVASATRLFAKKGLHATTSHEIARDAGYAVGTFYLHFKDKSEVHQQIVLQTALDLRERTRGAAAAAGDDPFVGLRARTEALVDFADENRAIIRIVLSADIEVASEGPEPLGLLAAGMAERLRTQQADGLVYREVNPVVAAEGFVGLMARLIDWWTTDPNRASRQEIIEALYRTQASVLVPAGDVANRIVREPNPAKTTETNPHNDPADTTRIPTTPDNGTEPQT